MAKPTVSENPLARQRYQIYTTVLNFRFVPAIQRVTVATFTWFDATKFAADQMGADDVIIVGRSSKPVAIVEVENPSAYLDLLGLVVIDGFNLPFSATMMLREAANGSDGFLLVEM